MKKYFSVFLFVLTVARAQYSASGTYTQPGWPGSVEYNASSSVAGRDENTGILRVGFSAGGKAVGGGGVETRVVSRDLSGNDLRITDIQGLQFFAPSDRECEVQIRSGSITGSGDWVPILASRKVATFGVPKKAQYKTPLATVDMKYIFYDRQTGKKIGEYTVPAGESTDISIGINDGHDVSFIGSTVGGYFDPSGNWVSSDTTNSILTTGNILNSQMVEKVDSDAGLGHVAGSVASVAASSGSAAAVSAFPKLGASATSVDGTNAVLDALGTINSTLKNLRVQNTPGTSSGGGGTVSMTATENKLDAIKTAIEGTTVTAQSYPSEPDADQKTSLTASRISSALGKLPVFPSVTAPSSSSVFAFNFTPPGLTQVQHFEVDFADYSAGITIFKTIVRGALAMLFFFITLRTIKEAFA